MKNDLDDSRSSGDGENDDDDSVKENRTMTLLRLPGARGRLYAGRRRKK